LPQSPSPNALMTNEGSSTSFLLSATSSICMGFIPLHVSLICNLLLHRGKKKPNNKIIIIIIIINIFQNIYYYYLTSPPN
jgi:mannose/fructose/N-acetylgalactosamine-specific phosphotransferase system component IID